MGLLNTTITKIIDTQYLMVCHLKDYIEKKEKKKIKKYMIIEYLIILITTLLPVTLSFEIKIRSTMSWYGSVSVIIIIIMLLIIY